jgi:hypothetical protein
MANGRMAVQGHIVACFKLWFQKYPDIKEDHKMESVGRTGLVAGPRLHFETS